MQGGSTITQQLARQSFLKPDKTIRRKLQELILASRIEAKYSKTELELYLNRVYFGDGLYGVEAASQGYFGKPGWPVRIRSRPAGRPGEGPVELRADSRHGARC